MQHSSHHRHCQISDIVPTSATRLRVLVYEASNDASLLDDGIGLEHLADTFDLELVRTLAEAVEHVRTEWFDAVLLDFNMSGASPELLIKRLRDSALTRPTPVVVRSLQPSVEQAVGALKAGAANYLVFDELDLQATQNAIEAAANVEASEVAGNDAYMAPLAADLELSGGENPVEQYALSLTHAVLTPLAAVQEFISLVLDGVTGHITDEQGKHLAFARGGCETIRASVLRGLDSARFGSDWEAEHSSIDLGALVGAAWQAACDCAETDVRPLDIGDFDPVRNVAGDVGYLTGLLGSLFKDAQDFAGAEGCVGVSVLREESASSRTTVVIATDSVNTGAAASEYLAQFVNERSYRGTKVIQSVGRELEYRITLNLEEVDEPVDHIEFEEIV